MSRNSNYSVTHEVHTVREEVCHPNQQDTQTGNLDAENYLDWIDKYRPYVGKVKRTFDYEPFWVDVYKDKSPNILVTNGRQTFKSTFGTDIIGYYATTHDDVELTYVVDRQDRVSAWSKQRFRKDTMQKNSALKRFLPHGRANVQEINLTNNSVVYVRTDENEYNNVQGMTNELMIFDECQYQELQFRSTALYSMSQTKGQVYYLGIGGELGSEWNTMWEKSDQREWTFDDPNWRKKLKFDEFGFLSNKDPSKIMKGKWIPQKPENYQYRGYHMPQTIFARIPLTIDDALKKYKTRPENSIEYQERYNPPNIVAAHVHGEFYKAMRRPITPAMVEACYDPNLSLLSGEQVRNLKALNKGQLYVFAGNDWGSGKSNAGETIAIIVIYWKEINRFQIVHIEKRPQELTVDSAARFVKLFDDYSCDSWFSDMGFERDGVTTMQKGGYDTKSNPIKGVGLRVRGVYSQGDSRSAETLNKTDYDITEKSIKSKSEHYSIQKTQIIDLSVGVLNKTVPNPKDPTSAVTQLIIPAADLTQIEFLAQEWSKLTRKDLNSDNEMVAEDDPRQVARKEYNHPADSLSAMNHVFFAQVKHDPSGFMPTVIKYKH